MKISCQINFSMPILSNNVLDSASFFTGNILNNNFQNAQKEEVLKNYFGDRYKINSASLWQESKFENNFINFTTLKESPREEKNYFANDDAIDTKQKYLGVKSVLPNINNTDARERVFLEKYRYFNSVNSSRNKRGILKNYAEANLQQNRNRQLFEPRKTEQ